MVKWYKANDKILIGILSDLQQLEGGKQFPCVVRAPVQVVPLQVGSQVGLLLQLDVGPRQCPPDELRLALHAPTYVSDRGN